MSHPVVWNNLDLSSNSRLTGNSNLSLGGEILLGIFNLLCLDSTRGGDFIAKASRKIQPDEIGDTIPSPMPSRRDITYGNPAV
ncbi:hypothetical protein CEXT_393061 [Caerostris extrusa]|uniref:Uncharacterized protein n=1 Tax=Caerostris extrusa TaxID=172846 RepID=A0AAV4VYE6_CAEEX|nr:hypothetical protein CEXT_393061 [Caerostris extrusa]